MDWAGLSFVAAHALIRQASKRGANKEGRMRIINIKRREIIAPFVGFQPVLLFGFLPLGEKLTG